MTRSTNTRKKALTMSLQVRHLFPQSVDACINGINSRLNLLHKEGLGNLTKMVQSELYSKAYTNKLLYRNPPPQDPLGGNGINEVVLDVVHHTPQQLQKVLPSKTAKTESLHEVPTTSRSLTLGWSKQVKKATASLIGFGTVAELPHTSN